MKFYTIKEIEENIKIDGFKYLRLERADGAILIPFNSLKITSTAAQLKKITNYLGRSKSLQDGIYKVVSCNLTNDKTERTVFSYAKGNVSREAMSIQHIVPSKIEKVEAPKELVSYEKLLDLHRQLAEQSYNIKLLQQTVTEQNLYIAELEADAAAAETGTADSTLSEGKQAQDTILSTIAKVADRLADKILSDPPAPAAAAMNDNSKGEPIKVTTEQLFTLFYENPELIEKYKKFAELREKQTIEANG